ncbi:MAG: acetyl-CoA carboxylase biotin carboxyl carrier protein [Turicibacter sp.]|nr:acetyl-CoA carboxylase biotin carboxyl carrier protein [Turicibacter sp.]
MEIKEIKALIEALDQSSVAKLKFVSGDVELKLEKEKKEVQTVVAASVASPVAAVAPAAPVASEGVATSTEQPVGEVVTQAVAKSTTDVTAPLVGVFYRAASPDAQPFVKVGQQVNEGDTVCILEAMKVLNEIKASKSGTVVAIHVENGDVVEFDQVLMEIGD